jgi:uncharacterized protein YjbI with pentapeptide repeats
MANVCILSHPSEPLTPEVEARVEAQGHVPVRVDPDQADLEAPTGALAASQAVVAVRPRGAAEILAIGVALGLRKQVFVLDAGSDFRPRAGAISVASLDALDAALRSAVLASMFIDEEYFRAGGGCKAGVAWFARRYPEGGFPENWTQEEQRRALADGGAPWLTREQLARVVRLWPMDGVDLRGADLQRGRLTGYSFVGAHLEGADLTRVVLRSAVLRDAKLTSAKLVRARLTNADLRGADLGSALLEGAILRGARLGGANLDGADLGGADLGGADLSSVDLRQTRIAGAHFGAAILVGANLEGCDLSGLDFTGGNLRGARLAGANLRATNLTRADLRGADVAQTDLSFAGLAGAMGVIVPTRNLR